jgi:hypothetical protein
MILRHARGLAASPPESDNLKVARSGILLSLPRPLWTELDVVADGARLLCSVFSSHDDPPKKPPVPPERDPHKPDDDDDEAPETPPTEPPPQPVKDPPPPGGPKGPFIVRLASPSPVLPPS